MAAATASTTCIRRGECYPLDEFQKLVGLGRHGMRAARRAGLKVRRVNGRAFVLSDDWFQYLDLADRCPEAVSAEA